MKRQTIGIMGFGEIGKSVAILYPKSKYKVLSKDLHHDNLKNKKLDILHVCIPYSNVFIKEVVKQIKKNSPKFTIIHSTVEVNTTSKINKRIGGGVVHSPVRGMHPNLTESLKTFIKYIGVDNKNIGNRVVQHFKSIGIKSKVFVPSNVTELNKILSTSYYGICIAWAGEIKRFCDKYNVDYKTFEHFNKTYNQGYKQMGLKNVIRPTLYPPKRGIGGHCIWENAVMFNKQIKSKYLQLIIDLGKQKDSRSLKVKKIKSKK